LKPPSREKNRKLEVSLDGNSVVAICGFKETGQTAKQQIQCNDCTQGRIVRASPTSTSKNGLYIILGRKYYRLLSTWQL
jgi:hypothetical protein